MKHVPRIIVHLVKLVYAADTAVGEDKRSTFQHDFLRFRVLGYVDGQTDG